MRSSNYFSNDKHNNNSSQSGNQYLLKIIEDSFNTDEIKFQWQDGKIIRAILKKIINTPGSIHLESMCRSHVNQDIIIKIRNGKKVSIEQERIIKF